MKGRLFAIFQPRRPGSTPGDVGCVVDKVALGQILSEYFGFSILKTLTAPRSYIIIITNTIIQGWYNGPDTGRRIKWTQSYLTNKELLKDTI
jgi:hypothetical protein